MLSRFDLFFLIRDRPYRFSCVTRGAVFFFQKLKASIFFSDKVKAFIFCNHKSLFYNCN